MIDAAVQDLRYALRALRSRPGFAAVAILSLALGIGANTAIFSLIDSVMLRTLPVSHPEQLLQVRTPVGFDDIFTNPLWEEIRDRQDVFSTLFAYSRDALQSRHWWRSSQRRGNPGQWTVFRNAGYPCGARQNANLQRR